MYWILKDISFIYLFQRFHLYLIFEKRHVFLLKNNDNLKKQMQTTLFDK